MTIGHYDPHGGLLRRSDDLPDQPFPASAAFFAAIHPQGNSGPAS